MKEPVLGVLGTGQFSAYLIAAMRRGGHTGRIILSPHNHAKADAIARQHGCDVAAHDAELFAAADWLLIAVRPEQLDMALAQIPSDQRKLLISAVAGVPVSEFQRWLGTSHIVFRILPASYIEVLNDGIIPLFPPNGQLQKVFAKAGLVVSFENEEQFDLTLAGSCISGWMYSFMDRLEDWFLNLGYSPQQARLVVSQNIAGAAAIAKARAEKDLMKISDEIATTGTYTKLGLDLLLALDAAAPWREALELVQDKLNRSRVCNPDAKSHQEKRNS